MYALTLGAFANVIIDDYASKKQQKKLAEAMNENEIAYIQKLASNVTHTVTLETYMEFALLRLGVVDQVALRAIRVIRTVRVV